MKNGDRVKINMVNNDLFFFDISLMILIKTKTLIIEATADTKNYSLVFEIYGTSDGRVASITKPVVTGVVAPPEDLYQDDPSLPSGTIKQIDYKAWGAKVTFNYVVTRDGQEIINKTFLSNYKPWQAVYLRGTGPSQ